MKKHLALTLLLVFLLGLAACGGKPGDTSPSTTDPGTGATTMPTTVPTTEPANNLRFGNVDLTGMGVQEAVQALTDAAAEYKLAMTVNGTAVLIPGTEISLAVDAQAVENCLNAPEEEHHLFTYDRNILMEIMGQKLNVAPQDAVIHYDAAGKRFAITEGVDGTEFDLNAAADEAGLAIDRLSPASAATVGTTRLEPARTGDHADLRSALDQANGYLKTELTYTYAPEGAESTAETIDAATLAGFVTIGEDLKVSINQDAIEEYAKKMSDLHNGADYKGKFVTTGGSTTGLNVTFYGQKLNKSALADDIYKCLTGGISGKRNAPYHAKSARPYGGSYVEVDLSSQKLWLYKNGEQILSTKLVSGSVAEGHRTPTGVYSIYAKQTDRYLTGEDYRSFVHYWMPFLGGYGLHDASWRYSFGGTIYYYEGSHGCVNLPSSAAKKIFNNVSVGTKVILYGGKTEVPDLEQKLSGTTSYTVTEGSKPFKLDIKAKYGDAKLTYTSSDPSVVTVSDNGTVTVVGAGSASITVKAEAFDFYTAAQLKVSITVNPAETQPTEPKPTEPTPTEPKPTEPAPTEPKPTEPAPTEPKPTEPAPTEPKPTEPTPTEPKPTEPAPTEPKPTEPTPTEPKPTEPAPTEPKPTEPAPTEPKPTEPAPTEETAE